MGTYSDGGRRGVADFMAAQVPSFTDFLTSHAPDLLPGVRGLGPLPASGEEFKDLPHATTIVAATCEHGVVLAGDRRATMGSLIAKRDIEKVFRSDEFSAMGFAGTGSLGIEFARLFQVELEHYEKMEGRQLSLVGKPRDVDPGERVYFTKAEATVEKEDGSKPRDVLKRPDWLREVEGSVR